MKKFFASMFIFLLVVPAGLIGQERDRSRPYLSRRGAQAPQPTMEVGAYPTSPAPTSATTARSGMLVDDLRAQSRRVSGLTPITVGAPVPFEEMRGLYGGLRGFGFVDFGGFGFQNPAYASLEPARELPLYIQQEVFEEYQRAGQWNPLIPGTGHMSQHLGVLEAESRTGRNPQRIGSNTWTTTKYVVVSSVGILEESVKGRRLEGHELVRVAEALGVSGRTARILWETVGRSRRAESDRTIAGILYLAIVDMASRAVLKSSTGIAAISYREFTANHIPGISTVSVRYPGAGKFARDLALSALYDPEDRDKSVTEFLTRRRK